MENRDYIYITFTFDVLGFQNTDMNHVLYYFEEELWYVFGCDLVYKFYY